MSWTMTSVSTLPWVGKTFISVDERLLRKYARDALGSVDNCYVEPLLNNGLIELLRVRSERYEVCKEVE